MKKFLILAAILLLVFAGCPDPKNERLPNLTIRNNSSYDLTDVSFSGISFGNISKSGGYVKEQLTESAVGNPSRITFTRSDIGIVCQTVEAKTYVDQDGIWIIENVTSVEEVGNNNNKSTLSLITLQPQLNVEYNGRNVVRNDIVNLGEAIIGIISPFDYILKNNGSGKLNFNRYENVEIINSSVADVFSIVQPTSSEISANGSLPFKINVNPKDEQIYTATVSISSDDPNGNFEFHITVEGVFAKAKVEFSANGATSGIPPAAQTVNVGSVITLPNQGTLVRSSCSFGGWNTEKNGTGTPYTAGTEYTFNESTTLYAQWILKVEFSANGATSGTPPAVQSVNAGSVIILPNQGNLVRAGYYFGGWNTEANGTGAIYIAGTEYTFNESTTLYVQWVLKVEFSANNATNGIPPAAQMVNADSIITLPNQGTLVSDYSFGGWNTEADGTGTLYIVGAEYTVNKSTTLYAQWILKIDIRGRSSTSLIEETIPNNVNMAIITGDLNTYDLEVIVAQRGSPLTIELNNVRANGRNGTNGAQGYVGGGGRPVISMGSNNNGVPLTIISKGSLNSLTGGIGGKGGKTNTNTGGNGWRGGTGGAAIMADRITIKGSAGISLTGGRGGEGGEGNPSPLFGGRHGHGGHGGTALDANDITIDMDSSSIKVRLIAGEGGLGRGNSDNNNKSDSGNKGLPYPASSSRQDLSGSMIIN